MPKAPYEHPSVFVAAYTPKAALRRFPYCTSGIPLEFHFADSAIRTRHVLDRIRRGIIQTDYSLFDITDWNANVTLELGLAEGLNETTTFSFAQAAGRRPASMSKGSRGFSIASLKVFRMTAFLSG